MIVFSCELINENISFNENEILDVKWFEYDKIIDMSNELRGSYVKKAITNYKNNKTCSMDIVDILKD